MRRPRLIRPVRIGRTNMRSNGVECELYCTGHPDSVHPSPTGRQALLRPSPPQTPGYVHEAHTAYNRQKHFVRPFDLPDTLPTFVKRKPVSSIESYCLKKSKDAGSDKQIDETLLSKDRSSCHDGAASSTGSQRSFCRSFIWPTSDDDRRARGKTGGQGCIKHGQKRR
jgi:hypothetical protein